MLKFSQSWDTVFYLFSIELEKNLVVQKIVEDDLIY